MPSFNYPEPIKEVKQNTVAITDREYKHSIVDTKVQPLNSLITHVEGSSRIVDWYSQILSANEEPQKYSVSLGPHLQQYRLIRDFEIKQTDFSFSFSEEFNEATATGSAYIYPPLIPNFGDMMVADIGNGQVGLLTVSRVEKKSIFKQACYEIDFALERLVDNAGEIDVLNQKVVETYHFVKDFILYGQNPLLVESEFLLLGDSKRILDEAINDYAVEFYSRELTCLTVPGYARPTYDPFAVKAFMEVAEVASSRRLAKINIRNTNELKEYWDNSVWAALISPSAHQHRSFWTKARPISVMSFNMSPRMNSLRFSGYDLCINPLDPLENVDTYYKLNENGNQGYYGWYVPNVIPITASGSASGNITSKGNACWCKVQNYYHTHHHKLHPWDPQNHLAHIEDYQHTCHDPACPCVCHYVKSDEEQSAQDKLDSYVFDVSFFDDGIASVDGFEQAVKAHLACKKIDPAVINSLLLSRRSWTPKERYYKMLVLIIMSIAAIRSM